MRKTASLYFRTPDLCLCEKSLCSIFALRICGETNSWLIVSES
ncbi:Uncharacterized protein dnm_018620 [Desulfonema magnum]|uniref:Uncharacterized protein n=1 Tax=Desulfonema magnum TaxID=45655 RepID=A0A975BI67_9BACT|nr:Uncharacterized protein dnm_018620 [Desulfonema magnum]